MLEFLYMQHFVSSSFEVAPRYTNLRPVKIKGSNIICSASDTLLGIQVAIKKIYQPFARSDLCQRAYLELKQLKLLKHENIAGLQDAFLSFGGNLYLISQHQGMTLDQCLASSTLQQYARVFFYQLLRGLKYLHSANIVHCDLKPSSILITRGCDLQITGLDHSRIHGERVTIDHVYDNANQCYQAPELMLDAQTYHPAMDMWAAGCVLAEMINGCPLFSEERCTNQLYAIIKLLGYAPGDLMDGLSSGNIIGYLKSLPARDWKPLRKHISTSDNEALDLLEQLLDFDPAIRYPATQALEHVYVSLYYDLADELTSDKTWSVADLDYAEWPVNDWKTLILSEIVDHHELRNGRQQPAECSN
ncbi:mitogen-activated protein kinase [Histoplasma capsulatum G186AR]|uniref:Mitogen-activated protein kinase n=1 Tax=Ajellomyces capsulatus TaxID=5037 RepID=A0A8H8CWH9_AJECA|nr:mitogen-activated protein kinase [Histoplasma capsulatum]QSS74597.1 mitogen-activated protein kinase [Histoplasma capsulatum G186AR]